MLIQGQGKRIAAADLLEAPHIKEAEEDVIYRSRITNDATFVVPPIAQAEAGNELNIVSMAEDGSWSTYLTLSALHLGKSLEFKVFSFHFDSTDWTDVHYTLKKKDGMLLSAKKTYQVKD
ncbi:hypothetical protein [Pseudomonas baetica]|uniref:hypothetical protein n=1 Tax=Pseudomonas baetica TaxID=674054 RepID=UPI0028719282|nr:hypothetical protein [Pseudomonas baetica]MDR9865753.1 hypothetical protein [Pseudomonas baetica]